MGLSADELGSLGVWTLDGSKIFFASITCFLCPLKRQWYLGFLSDPDGKLLLKGVVMRLSKICFFVKKRSSGACFWSWLLMKVSNSGS